MHQIKKICLTYKLPFFRFYTNIPRAPLLTFLHSSVIFPVIVTRQSREEPGKTASSSMFCLLVIIIIGDEKGILQRLSILKEDLKKRCIVWRKWRQLIRQFQKGFLAVLLQG